MSDSTKRVFVLDTNVLLSFGAQALHAFKDDEVVIPLIVVSELEKKRFDIGLEKTSREVLKELNAITGVAAESDEDSSPPSIRIEMNHVDQSGLDPSTVASLQTNDARILAVAYNLKSEGRDVTLVTEDVILSIVAKVAGVKTESFKPTKRGNSGYPSGHQEIDVDSGLIDIIYEENGHAFDIDDERIAGVVNNTFVTFKAGSQSVMTFAAVIGNSLEVSRVNTDQTTFGVKGLSREQHLAIDLLMNDDIKVVSLGGKAGTGKSLLAIMSGLEHIMEQQNSGYEKVTVFRPIQAVGGQELGHLPGTQEEKMEPWAQSVYDTLESELSKTTREEIAAQELIEVLPLTHIRGRTLSSKWIVLDEAQNLDLPSILAAISRTGKNSKFILIWDEAQRDNPHVSRYNGIVEAVNRMYGHELFGHVTLVGSHRSAVAEMASTLLDD